MAKINMTRRGFLGALIAASSLAAIGGAPLVKAGLRGDTYYMREREVLTDLYCPPWAKIVMAKNCIITGSYFTNTQINIPRDITDCILASNCFDNSGAIINFSVNA